MMAVNSKQSKQFRNAKKLIALFLNLNFCAFSNIFMKTLILLGQCTLVCFFSAGGVSGNCLEPYVVIEVSKSMIMKYFYVKLLQSL
jgi:hypothetical protein